MEIRIIISFLICVLQVQYSLFTGTRAVSFAIGNLENFSMARGGAAAVFNIIDSVGYLNYHTRKGHLGRGSLGTSKGIRKNSIQ